MRYEARGNTDLCRNVLNDLDYQGQKFARRSENVEVCSSCKFRERRCMGCAKVLKMNRWIVCVNVGVGFTGRGGLVP